MKTTWWTFVCLQAASFGNTLNFLQPLLLRRIAAILQWPCSFKMSAPIKVRIIKFSSLTIISWAKQQKKFAAQCYDWAYYKIIEWHFLILSRPSVREHNFTPPLFSQFPHLNGALSFNDLRTSHGVSIKHLKEALHCAAKQTYSPTNRPS